MFEQLILLLILLLSIAYIGYRIYSSFKKKQACDKCELMKAAKKNKI